MEMNDSLLRKKLATYNSMLDTVGQMEIHLLNEFCPVLIQQKLQELKALLYYEAQSFEADLRDKDEQ
jgi:hypothetical protein